MRALLPLREPDRHGAGHYGAPRGDRDHKGVDMACYPGTAIFPVVAGTISKLGYTYKDDLSYRYVEVMDKGRRRHRYFYILPSVREGAAVNSDTVIGMAQDLTKRYPGINNHVHVEIIDSDGKHIDPTAWVT